MRVLIIISIFFEAQQQQQQQQQQATSNSNNNQPATRTQPPGVFVDGFCYFVIIFVGLLFHGSGGYPPS